MRQLQLVIGRTQLRQERKKATQGLHQTYTDIFLSATSMSQVTQASISKGPPLIWAYNGRLPEYGPD
jgi:hypothetical protein